MAPVPTTVMFYRRPGNPGAVRWERRLRTYIRARFPAVRLVRTNADVAIVLGGDGTILEAARAGAGRILVGLNLGTVGFLATVRTERRFLAGIRAVLSGRFTARPRLMLDAAVVRSGRTVFRARVLNEIYVQSPLGMVAIDIRIGGTRIQRIRGTGALVATPTGSTGYNLSAHGPIVDPSLDLLVITEILDHDTPTPSIVVPADRAVTLVVASFRERRVLALGGTPCDVLVSADGQETFALRRGDRIVIRRAAPGIAIAQLETDYFYHSLHEKFSIA